MSKKKKGLICPECKNRDIIFDDIEVWCTRCGLVLKGIQTHSAGKPIKYPYGYLV